MSSLDVKITLRVFAAKAAASKNPPSKNFSERGLQEPIQDLGKKNPFWLNFFNVPTLKQKLEVEFYTSDAKII